MGKGKYSTKKGHGITRPILVLLTIFVITVILASCSTEEQGVKVYFADEEWIPSSVADEVHMITPSPGHVIIGQIAPGMSSSQAVPESVMSMYTQTSGSTMEIKNYDSDKELIDAARSGEIDVVFGNNLVAHILGNEDALVDLEPALTTIFANGEYYTNIIDAGRINGKLVMVTPQFAIGNSIVVPQGAVKKYGTPTDSVELIKFFDLLEPEYRSGTVYSIDLIHGALDLQKHSFDISSFWDNWTTLLRKQDKDQEVSKLFASEKVYPALFGMVANNRYQDPITHYSYFVKEDGTSYTKYGPTAVLIPYTYQENIGYSIEMATYCITEQAQNKNAALHLVQWLLSEEGQEAGLEREHSWTGHACPVLRSTAKRWFLRYRNSKEIMYTVEEQQTIVEDYIAQANHIPAYSSVLLETTRSLLTGYLSKTDRNTNMAIYSVEKKECWKVLIEFYDRFEHEEETPKFYQEGTLDIWPELVNDYIRAYITNLGYDMY